MYFLVNTPVLLYKRWVKGGVNMATICNQRRCIYFEVPRVSLGLEVIQLFSSPVPKAEKVSL